MLNTKYCILNPNQDALHNPMAQGNAWFVSNTDCKTVDEVQALGDSSIDLDRSIAVIHMTLKTSKRQGILMRLKLVLDKVWFEPPEYAASSEFDGPAVFSEVYYPDGWNCYIDGKSGTF